MGKPSNPKIEINLFVVGPGVEKTPGGQNRDKLLGSNGSGELAS